MGLAQNDYEVEYDASDIQRAIDDIEAESSEGCIEALKEDPFETGMYALGTALYGPSFGNILLSADEDAFESVQAPEHIARSSSYSGEMYETIAGLQNAAIDFTANAGTLEEQATATAGIGGLALMGAGLARSYSQNNQDSMSQDLRQLKQELEE